MMYEVPIKEVRIFRAYIPAKSASEAMDKADALLESNEGLVLISTEREVIDARPASTQPDS